MRTRPAPRRFDPIQMVEAAYNVQAPTAAWLRGLVDAASPGMDIGLGVSASLFERDGDRVRNAGTVSTAQASEAHADEVFDLITPELADRYYWGNVPQVVRASDQPEAALHGVLEFFSRIHGTRVMDVWGISVADGRGRGLVLNSLSNRGRAPAVTLRWRRLAYHVAAGVRLRTRLGLGPAHADAVLTPDGRMLEASTESTRQHGVRHALSAAVAAMDGARGTLRRLDPDESLARWKGLVAGEYSVVDWLDTDGRRFVVAHRNPPHTPDPRALTPREAQVAEFLVHGRTNAEIAYALGIALGTVSGLVKSTLRKLGNVRRTQLAEVFGGGALSGGTVPQLEDLVVVGRDERDGDAGLWADLSEAERDIASAVLAGASNRTIAQQRGRSEHTVANQLQRLYTRLGVSGRSELAALLGGRTR